MKKSKVRMLALMLALSLGTSGCGSSLQEKTEKEIDKIMSETDFYQDDYASNEKYYSDFFDAYIDNLSAYMSKKQCKKIIELVNAIPDIDKYDDASLLSYLDEVFSVDINTKGYGFYHAFNNYLLFENLRNGGSLRDDTFIHILTIKSLVDNDEEFFEALFTGNIKEIINVIVKNTNADASLVKELIKDFDKYAKAKVEGQKTQDEYAEKIQEEMNILVKTKIESDEEFSKTFYARMLKESIYYGNEGLLVIHPLISGNSRIELDNENRRFLVVEFDQESFKSTTVSLADVKTKYLESKIEGAFESSNDRTMQLMSYLLDSDVSLEDKNPSKIRERMYANLYQYFDSQEDFDDFLLRLFSLNSYAQERYMNIFCMRLKDDGIDLLDFYRYQALVNLNEKNTHNSYYSNGNHLREEDVYELRPNEAEHISNSKENYLLNAIDYDDYFEYIENSLSYNNLGYDLVLNKEVEFGYLGDSINVYNLDSTTVYSEIVDLQTTYYEGNKVLYFEAPSGFEDGGLVEVYKNLNGESVVRRISGLRMDKKDEETGKVKRIIIVSLNGDDSMVSGDIRFETPLKIFESNYQNQDIKMLTQTK